MNALRIAAGLTLAMALYVGWVVGNSFLVLLLSSDQNKAYFPYLPGAVVVLLLLAAAWGAFRAQRWCVPLYSILVAVFAMRAWQVWPATAQFLQLAQGSPWATWVALSPYVLLVLTLGCAIVVYKAVSPRR